MSSESESNTLNRLIDLEMEHREQQLQLSEIAEKPYQPTVYAIPKDQWQQMLRLLKEQSEFHETLLEVMDRLPTEKEIERFMNTTLERQLTMFSSQTDEVKASVRLAGSSQEKFISEASSLRQEQSKELKNALDRITKRVYKFTAAIFLTSILLSGLVSVLCLQWLT